MRRTVIAAVVCLIGIIGTARPQGSCGCNRAPSAGVAPAWLGLDGVLVQPVGEFRRYVARGTGMNVSFVVRPPGWHGLGVRAEVSESNYGEDTRRLDSGPVSQLIALDVVTRNQILTIGIGPEVVVPIGPLSFDLAPQLGMSRFATNSTAQLSGQASDATDPSQTKGSGPASGTAAERT